MTRRRGPSIGQTISTFTFLLFGLLLGLGAMAEGLTLRGVAIGFCATLSILAALRFRLQALLGGRPR